MISPFFQPHIIIPHQPPRHHRPAAWWAAPVHPRCDPWCDAKSSASRSLRRTSARSSSISCAVGPPVGHGDVEISTLNLGKSMEITYKTWENMRNYPVHRGNFYGRIPYDTWKLFLGNPLSNMVRNRWRNPRTFYGSFELGKWSIAGGCSSKPWLKGVEFNHRHRDFNKKNMHVLRDFTSLYAILMLKLEVQHGSTRKNGGALLV